MDADDELDEQRRHVSEYILWNPIQLFLSFKATVFESAWVAAFFITLLQAGVCVLQDQLEEISMKMDGHKLLLTPLAFLVVFRTSNSYNRQWEGRGLLGALVFNARELFSKTVCMTPLDKSPGSEQFCQNVYRYTMVTVYLIIRDISKHWDEKEANRRGDRPMPTDDDRELEDILRTHLSHEENEIVAGRKVLVPLLWLRHQVAGANSCGMLTALQQTQLDDNIAALHQTWAGMMKIVTTPLPFPFAHLLNILIWCFLISLPVPLAHKDVMGYYSIPVTFFVTITFLGLCEVGKQLENPFGRDINDFHLDAFKNTICNDLKMFMKHRETMVQYAEKCSPASAPARGASNRL